jgi:hypothetical protein
MKAGLAVARRSMPPRRANGRWPPQPATVARPVS